MSGDLKLLPALVATLEQFGAQSESWARVCLVDLFLYLLVTVNVSS